jgi:hypothetical protein
MKNFTLIALCAMLFSTGSLVAQPTTVATTPTKAVADVLSIYSDAYTSLAGTDFYPYWDQATPVGFTDIVVAGDNIKGYTSLSYQGTQFASAINVSTYQNLHIDLWSPNCATFDLYLIGGGEQKVTLTPNASGWNSFDVPLSSYSALTLGAIIQFKFVAMGTTAPMGSSSSVYVDNIYFWKPANVPTLTGFIVADKLTTAAPFALTAPTSPSSGAFTYTSSNSSVATVSGNTVTIVGAGTTTITANQAAAGAYAAGSTSAVLTVTSPGPSTAAPTPTRAAGDVTSLFSNAYTNVGVNTWSAVWDVADVTDVMIAGNETKKYTNHTFSGIEFVGANIIDATSKTHIHMDVWTADAAGVDGFKVKLRDFGANGTFDGGDDAESIELPFTATANGWYSIDAPLSSFTGLTNKAHLAQLVLVTPGGGKTFWVDNIYFYATAVPPSAPTVAAPTPTNPIPNVISLFSGAYTDVAGTNWNPGWGQATVYSEVMVAGNPTKKYDNMNYQGAQLASPINLTATTDLHVDVWTSSAADFKIKLVDFGVNLTGENGGGDDSEGELSFTTNAGTWTTLNIPLSNFNMTAPKFLTSRAHIGQFIISTATTTGGRLLVPPSFYVDNIYFYANVALGVELTNLTAKSINKTTVLNWQTASEKDNQGFTVERSLNGTDYAAIGQVKGFGTTNTVRNYTFTDATPTNGVNYYRLRQADFNGKESLSKVVSVISGKNFLVLKNTLVQNLLDVTVGEDQKGPLSIFNVSGQLVYSAKVQGNQLLDVSALTSGLYIVRTEAGDVSRFVKE